MTPPQCDAAPPPPQAVLPSKVSELVQVCVGLGMSLPEFNYVSKQQVSQNCSDSTASCSSPGHMT